MLHPVRVRGRDRPRSQGLVAAAPPPPPLRRNPSAAAATIVRYFATCSKSVFTSPSIEARKNSRFSLSVPANSCA